MRTFKLCLGIDIKAVLPESVVQGWRTDATSEEATPFLKNTQAMFPVDDDAFALHILKHGCRSMVRSSLRSLFESTGIGGTLSPASCDVLDVSDTLVVHRELPFVPFVPSALPPDSGVYPLDSLG